MMKIYVISLVDALDRRKSIDEMFRPYKGSLNVSFVEAVDGRKLSNAELREIFSVDSAYAEYGRFLMGGEIGCTESHRKCCKEFLEGDNNVAMIVEDDIVLRTDNLAETLSDISRVIDCHEPMIVLLSGDYWYTRLKRYKGIQMAEVREAVSSHAYLLNRKAAEIILQMENSYLADDWFKFKQAGIKLYALYPHIADQNFRDYCSSISKANSYMGINRKNLSFTRRIYSYYRAIVKHILYYTNHFEHRNHLM